MDYLKDEQYYSDLYDLTTIKDCLWTIDYWKKSYKENVDTEKLKKVSKKEKLRGFYFILNLDLHVRKVSRFKNRQMRINEWMEADRLRDEKLESTSIPNNITCPSCGLPMQLQDKHLDIGINKQPDRVEFFFACFKCKQSRIIYNTGEEHIRQPRLCTKCRTEVVESASRKGDVITWIYKCPSCKFIEKETDDFGERQKKRELEEQQDKELLAKHRKEFCLSEAEGQRLVLETDLMMSQMKALEEHQQQQADPDYQKAIKLKKLKIVEVEKLLSKILEKQKYIKLILEKPEMDRFVIVPFSVQEADSSRKEYESVNNLKKLTKKALEGTNWRLMTDGPHYRLGYISGRLKGYEREEDLMEIIRRKKDYEKKNSPVMVDEKGPIY